MCVAVLLSRSINWNLRGCPRGQCVTNAGGQPTSFGPLDHKLLRKLEFGKALAPPLGELARRKAVTERVLFHWQDTPSVKNQRFLPPPSKREARKRQITIFCFAEINPSFASGKTGVFRQAAALQHPNQLRQQRALPLGPVGKGAKYRPGLRVHRPGGVLRHAVAGAVIAAPQKPQGRLFPGLRVM